MDDDKAGRGRTRKICFIVYFILVELIGIACLGLAAYAMTSETITKLRIWDQFDESIPNLPPLLVVIASVLMVIAPVVGLVGVIRESQVIITIFFSLIIIVAFTWFGIGAWCLSLHKLIMGDISIKFERLNRDGQALDSNAQQFLLDLQENMPRITTKHDYQCCPSTEVDALYSCAQECGSRYESFFRVVIFPVLYTTLFGVGCLCMLSLLCACLVSCHLDDVNPVF